MNEPEFIKDQLKKAFYGGAWHGPSVMESLENISAKNAASKPINNAHSIWEIVLHINIWHICVRKRISGERYEPQPEEDWPETTDKDINSWEKVKDNLKVSLEEVINTISLLDESILSENIPGKDYNFYTILHGLIQHDIYHAGQIAILKKALTDN